MDKTKKFSVLMKEVTDLNPVNVLKQLKTVNENITLIRLWFLRAEVRLLESMLNTHYRLDYS